MSSAGLRRPSGLLFTTDPDARQMTTERPTLTCNHCQYTKVIYEKGQDLGGLCYVCYKLICGPCVEKGICDPWERQLERMEAEWESRRSMGLT